MIGVAVRERHRIEAPEGRVANDGRNDAVADVERAGRGEAAGVDEQRAAVREAHERRVALADVDEGDVQQPVAASGDERTRVDENPERGNRCGNGPRSANASRSRSPE